MANKDEEIKSLIEKNNELAQKVQYWKMIAGQRENDNLALMKECNELRLNRMKSTSGVQAPKLESMLQQGHERALAHMVQASSEIAHMMELTKEYIRGMKEPSIVSPRWGTTSGSPKGSAKPERVHRVPPTLVGGRSIQPVVALSRTLFDTSRPGAVSRSPNRNRNTERPLPVPMHTLLQDLHIPLIRIDATEVQGSNTEDGEHDNVAEDMELEDEPQRLSEEFNTSRQELDTVAEDSEPDGEINVPTRNRVENPLEGPSWLLDLPPDTGSNVTSRLKEEPDSTTGLNESPTGASTSQGNNNKDGQQSGSAEISVSVSCEFSPTVRRRKRTTSPILKPTKMKYPPRNASRRDSANGRVLKVMVAKMRLSTEGEMQESPSLCSHPSRSPSLSPSPTPVKRPKPSRLMSFDAPSPNGSTDFRVIVSDANQDHSDEAMAPINHVNITVRSHKSRSNSRDSHQDRSDNAGRKDYVNRRNRNDGSDNDNVCAHESELPGPSEAYDDSVMRAQSVLRDESVLRDQNVSRDESVSRDQSVSRNQSMLREKSVLRDQSVSRERSEVNKPADSDTRRGASDSEYSECTVKSKKRRVGQGENVSERHGSRRARHCSRSSNDSDSGSAGEGLAEGRSRRTRKNVTYKEKPLNRKMRR